MTSKLIKAKLINALFAALCLLAVAFAVVMFTPRGAASAEDPVAEATYTVTWEYKTAQDSDDWQQFVHGSTLFTYEDNVDYSMFVRAKIDLGEGVDPDYVYYAASSDQTDSAYLAYSGTFDNENVTTLVNAAEYTATIVGASDGIAAVDKTIKFKILPRVFDLSESDFEDYHGDGEVNKLWLLDGISELRDLATYYDPDAEFDSEYGAKVTTGVLYNAYVRYTGQPHTINLNDNYNIDGKGALKDYKSAISVEYDNATATGAENKVNKIITTAIITLNGNWTLDNGENTISFTKEWYIVTINNALRTLDGDANTAVAGWAYGAEVPALSIRPEHGDTAVFTLGDANSTIARFAVTYDGKADNTTLAYYDVKADNGDYVIDTDKALDGGYYAELFGALKVGAYTLNVSVPAYTSTDNHEHWWNNAEEELDSVVYYPISRTYHFTVGCYEVTPDSVSADEAVEKDIMIKLLSDHVAYNAMDNNVPEMTVTFRGTELKYDEDYLIESPNIKVGRASFTFVGKGSFTGSVPFDDMYDIDPAINTWKEVPSIMYWTYGNYDKNMNLISAAPTYLDNPNDMSFKITVDQAGEVAAATPLASFRLTDGTVSNDVADALSTLKVGTYYLFATVKESSNYKALSPRGVAFKVFKAPNLWEVFPTIASWTEGSFSAKNNMPEAKALYGNATIVIRDNNGKEVYNTVTGVNKLGDVGAGMYTLTATVLGTDDYDGAVYSMVFTVHEKPGIPVWATVLIVLGALLLVALIVFILIKTKVLRILTDKLMVNIRTQAAVDATVAAVRANKKNDEYKQQVSEAKQQEQAEAKRRERKEARKAKAAQEKAMPVDQKIAALEEKARKAEARAEKMKARAEAIQQRAELMRAAANPTPAEEPTTAPAEEPTTAPAEEPAPTPAEEPTAAPAEEPTAAPMEEAAATENKTSTEKKPSKNKKINKEK